MLPKNAMKDWRPGWTLAGSKETAAAVILGLATVLASSPAQAWDPPDGPADVPHEAYAPATPTTRLAKAHGYIIQDGITILYQDGYWFAADFMRTWQQELLNGVRYADVYRGKQVLSIKTCEFFGAVCQTVSEKDWWLAADNHYFNPETGLGYQPGALDEVAFWVRILGFSPGLSVSVTVKPEALEDVYPSALSMFATEYDNATSAFTGGAPLSIGGKSGTALSLFYLGWASHLAQDQWVVHHTKDEALKHHSEYESAADGLEVSLANQSGIYMADTALGITRLTQADCPDVVFPARTCIPDFAARQTHWGVNLQNIDNGDYSTVSTQVWMAAAAQAGILAEFLSDVGKRPVHMSAVVAAIN